uniref:Uncharacterized protein n=1 Tax=Cacopsylla melanoneura TaxID=428564 RepID=A0A8D8VCH9_9HEMI
MSRKTIKKVQRSYSASGEFLERSHYKNVHTTDPALQPTFLIDKPFFGGGNSPPPPPPKQRGSKSILWRGSKSMVWRGSKAMLSKMFMSNSASLARASAEQRGILV